MSSWKNFNYASWAEKNDSFNHEEFEKAMRDAFAGAQDICDLPARLPFPRPPWQPAAYYNEQSDALEITLSTDGSYAHWLNPQITVMQSMETGEITGVQINGISNLLHKNENRLDKTRK